MHSREGICTPDLNLIPEFADDSDKKPESMKQADLLFDWFGFDQTMKTVVHSTLAKQQLNPNNKINRK